MCPACSGSTAGHRTTSGLVERGKESGQAGESFGFVTFSSRLLCIINAAPKTSGFGPRLLREALRGRAPASSLVASSRGAHVGHVGNQRSCREARCRLRPVCKALQLPLPHFSSVWLGM